MKHGDKGPKVKELQQNLIFLGYELPRWGADGDLGDETLGAATDFLEDRGHLPAGSAELDQLTTAQVKAISDAAKAKQQTPRPVQLVDCTGLHAGTRRRGARAWSTITSIVLHQTDCVLGEKPSRWFNIPVQVGVTRGGQILYLNPLHQRLNHAHALNGDTIGIEIDGHYEGIEGKIKTYQDYGTDRKPQTPTAEGIDAAREAVRWICDEARANGGEIKFIWAHRQGSNMRQRDPGSYIWREVALWAETHLGVLAPHDFSRGTGTKIPKDWDPRSKTKY